MVRCTAADFFCLKNEWETEVTQKIYGYARVSSRDQNEARQILALEEAGVKDENIYTDYL